MCAAITSADRQRAAELQRGHEVPRDALVGERRPRPRVRRVRRRAARARGGVGSPQRAHPPRSHGSARMHSGHSRSLARVSARRHDAQPGGAIAATSSPIQSTHESLPGLVQRNST